MVMITGITGGLDVGRLWHMFEDPDIAVDVVAFHLMSGSCRSPQETLRKFEFAVHCFSFLFLLVERIRSRIFRNRYARRIPVSIQNGRRCSFFSGAEGRANASSICSRENRNMRFGKAVAGNQRTSIDSLSCGAGVPSMACARNTCLRSP